MIERIKVTRSELVQRIAAKVPNLTIREVDSIVDVIFNSMLDALAEGNKVEIRGFCALSTRQRKPRISTNPKTQKVVEVPSRNVLYFRIGKELHKLLNEQS